MISLAILIEANECLKASLNNTPASEFMRAVNAQSALEVQLDKLLAAQAVEVAQ
jgi:hypothetical protein